MPSDISTNDLATAVLLLDKHSSLDVVSKLLKSRNLHWSANSWREMQEKRLQPALDNGELSRADIISLVREAEEFGKQHVFLYQCHKTTAAELLNEQALSQRLKKMGLESLRSKPLLVNITKGMQLVDIRIETVGDMRSLVIKAVDTRTFRKLVDKQIEGSREILTYDLQYDRGVNVISVRADGLTEVRIQSHKNTLDYRTEVENMFAKATGVIDPLKFSTLSLAKARLYLINNRKKLSKYIRFCDNLLRDKEGNALSLASGGPQQNLYEEGGASDKSVDAFLSVGRPTCDEVDCIWLKQVDNSGPSSDIHTLIEGANNEFNVTAHCQRADYAYVLEKITSFAK